MLSRLAPWLVRRRRLVLVLAIVVLAAAGAYGGGVAANLTSGGFDDPASESTRASETLSGSFDAGDPDLVLVATAAGG